ncbi:DJ-1/PfpI family protein [Sphingomonas sp. MMS12-HWE2-04]|uniref:DJ-1/PfpI family protein n=1 Tax=Sphingomonas sp. MMS12-HWE2-04 TaxID=3234199 RepID=UPI003850EF95
MSAGGQPVRIVIPVYDGFDLLDVCGPSEMFHWAGFQVDLVAAAPGMITANNGFALSVADGFAAPAPCDALWVPGGDTGVLSAILQDPARTYLDFLTAQAPLAGYVCAVCVGSVLLAGAGLLDGHVATSHWATIPTLLQDYPAVTVADGHPRYTLDRNRLTGGGISSGLDEALGLIELLAGTAKAQDVQQTTQYYPDPPVHSQIPNTITSPITPPPSVSAKG